MPFEIVLHKRALNDISRGFEYYNEQQKGLGKRFAEDVDKSLSVLIKNPFFQIRYDDYHCLPLKKFPFMIHYVVNEKEQQIEVYAVIHTSLDPETNWLAG